MKHAYILTSFFLLVMMPAFSQAEDLGEKPLKTFKIPITEAADRAINIITKHTKCTLAEFLQRNGIPFGGDQRCDINSKTNVVTLHLDHHSAALVIAILGDIIIYVLGDDQTPGEIIKKYASDNIEEGCSFFTKSVNVKEVGEHNK